MPAESPTRSADRMTAEASPPQSPFIEFERAGVAPILSYNVPAPVSYFGTHLIELDLPTSHFREVPTSPTPRPDLTVAQVRAAMLAGFVDRTLFSNLGANLRYYEGGPTTALRGYAMEVGLPHVLVPDVIATYKTTFTDGAGREITRIDVGDTFLENLATPTLLWMTPEVLHEQLRLGNRIKVRFNRDIGKWDVVFLTSAELQPRLAVLETYRLTSYLGDYGAGRVVNTFSLLPGEKTRITVKTYHRTTSVRNEASSILDSYSKESADDFEKAVKSETADKQESQRRDEWSIEAEGSVNYGAFSAKMSAGYAGSSNAGREQCVKNVSNATSKTASRASNKRDIQVQQVSSTKVESGMEDAIEREIQNINTGRTLNFVFRQMNQEFITMLHLVDAQIAFIDVSRQDSLRVVNLPELDALLEEVLAPSEGDRHRLEAVAAIRETLENVFDYQDVPRSVVEEGQYGEGAVRYLRFRRDVVSRYDDRIDVPGVVLSVQKNVLRTDGLIVEALLGQSEGLDDYSKGLQTEQVRARRLANESLALQVGRARLLRKILEDGDTTTAKVFSEVFHKSSLAKAPGA